MLCAPVTEFVSEPDEDPLLDVVVVVVTVRLVTEPEPEASDAWFGVAMTLGGSTTVEEGRFGGNPT